MGMIHVLASACIQNDALADAAVGASHDNRAAGETAVLVGHLATDSRVKQDFARWRCCSAEDQLLAAV